MESLREKQAKFLVCVSKLVAFAYSQNIKICVLEWYRTKERQEQLVKEGKSWTMNSKHISGLAVDLGILKDGNISWDYKDYEQLGEYWEKHLGQTWGGNWKQKDCVHFEYKN